MKKLVNILLICLLLLPAGLFAQTEKADFTESSVLSSGIWFKIAVTKDGIYRIDFSKLKQIGIGKSFKSQDLWK